MSIALAERLRTATRELHTEVERAGIMRRLLRGPIDRAAYCVLLRNLAAIYAALEQGLAQHALDAALAPVLQEGLFRRDALVQDLQHLHGPAWQRDIALVPAAADYAAHLRVLSGERPALLAAHAYVRYLGDLSGGQMLSRIVATQLGLRTGEAVAFYDFGPPAEVARRAGDFRAGLERLAPAEADAQALIDEACAAFERHRLLFDQIDRA